MKSIVCVQMVIHARPDDRCAYCFADSAETLQGHRVVSIPSAHLCQHEGQFATYITQLIWPYHERFVLHTVQSKQGPYSSRLSRGQIKYLTRM